MTQYQQMVKETKKEAKTDHEDGRLRQSAFSCQQRNEMIEVRQPCSPVVLTAFFERICPITRHFVALHPETIRISTRCMILPPYMPYGPTPII